MPDWKFQFRASGEIVIIAFCCLVVTYYTIGVILYLANIHHDYTSDLSGNSFSPYDPINEAIDSRDTLGTRGALWQLFIRWTFWPHTALRIVRSYN